MRKLVLTAVAALLSFPVFAADMPVKALTPLAPAQPGCTVNSCVGFYAGLDITGAGTNMNVLGNGLNGSLNAAGTELGGHVGYRAWNGTIYLGAEAGCSYDVSSNVQAIGFADRLRCMELVKGGGALSALFSNSSPQFPIPPALQNSFMSFYAILGASQRLSTTGVAAGVGAEFYVLRNMTMTLDYINVNYTGGGPSVNGVANVKDENLFRLGINYNF